MQSIIDKMPDNWESELEYQLLCRQADRCSKRAYICSPCSDRSKKIVNQNMRTTRYYMYYALNEMCVAAKAPHAYLPTLFSDAVPSERALALRVGLQVLEISDIVFVCGDRISSGMRGEIEYAAKLGIPILVFHPDRYLDVQKIVTRAGADKRLVSYEARHPLLSRSAEDLFSPWGE